MGKINPRARENTDAYKDQKGFDRVVPVKGTYDVVNIKMQWQRVGKNATEKLRVITHVLKVVECAKEDEEGAKAMVGKTFGQDIWWNLYKDGRETNGLNFNGQRLVNLAIANGCDAEFDPEDRDELVKILCAGTPYRCKIDVEKQGTSEKPFYNVNVLETKHLSVDGRKKYTALADFAKVMPRPEDRRLDDADYSAGRDGGDGGSRGGGSRKGKRDDTDSAPAQGGDPFRADDADGSGTDDLPFKGAYAST